MSIIQYTVNQHEHSALQNIKRQIFDYHAQASEQAIMSEEIIDIVAQNICTFAPELTATYQSLRQSRHVVDAIYVSGLPIFSKAATELSLAKLFAIGLSKVLGEPFQYKQQHNGEIAAEITPTKELEHTNSSGGRVSFGWHSDDSFLSSDYRTKWIQLLGYHNPGQILTKVAAVDNIVQELKQSTIDSLIKQQFQVKIPSSFTLTSSWSEAVPILRINGSYRYEINVPTYNVQPCNHQNHQAWTAIQELIQAANVCQQAFCIADDALLTFNNDRMLHARNEINTERLILRTYIRKDLEALKKFSSNKERVFDISDLFTEDAHGIG